MGLSNETARLFTGLIPIRRFDSGRVKSDLIRLDFNLYCVR